jgi:hypothetical protein
MFSFKKVLAHFIEKAEIFSATSQPTLQAYRCYGWSCETLVPCGDQNDRIDITPLSEDIIQKPGFVQVAGLVYDLRKDGVYRFYKLPSLSEQRIVCSSGLMGLYNILGYLWAYGLADVGKSVRTNRRLIKKKVLMLGCSDCSFLAVDILNSLGVKARVVVAFTAKPWGGQDDGHTLVEVFSDGTLEEFKGEKWMLYDPSFNTLFYADKIPLSLREMINMRSNPKTTIIYLPGNHGHPYWRVRGYDYGFWIDHRVFDKIALRRWYEDKLNIELIYNNGSFFFNESSAPSHLLPILRKRYKPLNDLEFNKKFY